MSSIRSSRASASSASGRDRRPGTAPGRPRGRTAPSRSCTGGTSRSSSCESSVRPWKAPSNATTPGRPVCSRASFTAFSTASVPALKNAARVSPEIGASAHSRSASSIGGLVRDDREVRVEEPRGLLGDRLDDPRVGVAGVDHADAAGEVDEDVAVDVRDRRVLGALGEDRQVDDQRDARSARSSRSRSARERGPGISVRISIVLVAAIRRSLAEPQESTFAPWTRGSRASTPTRSSSFAAGSTRRVAAGLHEPEAMALATATPDGTPSVRMVLLRGLDERGLRVLHELREPEGAGARGEPAGRGRAQLGPAAPAAGARRGTRSSA